MRKNLPVNNVETLLPDGEFIYSRTDLKGVIVEANEAFANISGFTREEMIGQPHNIVRHPDMPPEAFADLWEDLKKGRPWRGIVKNRRKDGGFYWVVANASPVRENGQVVGYQSVRARPTRDEIAAAEAAYRRIRDGDRSIRVEHGRVVRVRPAWLRWGTSLPVQLNAIALAAVAGALLQLIGAFVTLPGLASVGHLLAALILVYGLFFLFVYAPRLNGNLQGLADWLEQALSSGNLTRRFDLPREDLVGTVARRADKFVCTVQATVQGMSDAARQVERASQEVRIGMRRAQDSARVQSEATSSAAAAVEQVTVSIGEVAAHAQATRDVAERTGTVSREGAEVSGKATETIVALADSVKDSAAQVETLGARSGEINRIVAVIREIAEQTNLLALNAAIEAARAGEQGRGFAVVADEVRKLAERTGKATREIGDMISSIIDETGRAVDGMRAGAGQVENGVALVNAARESLSEINRQMADTQQMVNDISHASSEQQVAMTQLAQNVEQVATMTEQNVAVVNQTGAMVACLDQLVERMRKATDQFAV